MKNKIKKPILLIILDGFGLRKEKKDNPIADAKKVNFDYYWKKYPHCILEATNGSVGLPKGILGNSEVGHMNIGAGRIVKQEITRINEAIKDRSFFNNKILLNGFYKANKLRSNLHLIGLTSKGGVHAHINHLIALLKLARRFKDIKNVYIHFIADGRDTPEKIALEDYKKLESFVKGKVKIATVSGRYYAMDRDKRWNRTLLAFNAIALARGIKADNFYDAVKKAYARKESDEFITPTVVNSYRGFEKNDVVIFYNFRSDRIRQIVIKILPLEKKFNLSLICFSEYDKKFKLPIAFPPLHLKNILAEIISRKGLKQLRIAETEKYAHVTYFFNCGIEKPFKNEYRILVPSPKVATYDLKPEMSAYEVTNKLIEVMHKFDFIVLNYANPDMVGHTGKHKAIVKAIEAVDFCLGRVVSKALSLEGKAIITADHGNAEESSGRFKTSHTFNKVPFIIVDDENRYKLKKKGILGNIAPTVLDILGFKKPKEMLESLIIKKF